MSLTSYKTWTEGSVLSAAELNEQIRDNGNALWVGTTAGDLDYYTSSTDKARLGISTIYKLLAVNSAGTAPAWTALGTILPIGISSAISTSTTSTSYADVTNGTVTLTLNSTSTVLMFAQGCVTSASGDTEYVKGFIGATETPESIVTITAAKPMNWNYIAGLASVAAGSVTCKLKFKSGTGNTVNLYNGKLFALAIPTE